MPRSARAVAASRRSLGAGRARAGTPTTTQRPRCMRRTTSTHEALQGDSRSILGHGARAVLLHLPGRDRCGQGRRRQDDRHRGARHRGSPHGHERADRRGRGQIGARGVLRSPAARLRGAGAAPGAPGPHAHPRRGAARLPRGPRAAPDLEAPGRERRARRRATAVPDEGHPRARQGQGARAGRGGRPHRDRRPRRRPRDHLPHVGARACSTRCGSGPSASRPPTWSSSSATRRAAR